MQNQVEVIREEVPVGAYAAFGPFAKDCGLVVAYFDVYCQRIVELNPRKRIWSMCFELGDEDIVIERLLTVLPEANLLYHFYRCDGFWMYAVKDETME